MVEYDLTLGDFGEEPSEREEQADTLRRVLKALECGASVASGSVLLDEDQDLVKMALERAFNEINALLIELED